MKPWIGVLFLLGYLSNLVAQEYHFEHYPFDSQRGELKGNVMYQDASNRIWIGTDNGLLSFDGMEYRRASLGNIEKEHQHITAIHASDQSLWLGTHDGHVFYGSPDNFTPCASSTSPIRAITGRDTNHMWIATYGDGLYGSCGAQHISSKSGKLLSDDIYAMTLDSTGDIWIGCDAGISILHSSDTDEESVRRIGKKDGLTDEIIMTVILHSDGSIWAGAFEDGICNISDGKITYPFPDWQYGAVLEMVVVSDREIWISTERNGVLRYNIKEGLLSKVDLPGNATPVIADMMSDNEGNLWLLDVYRGLYRTNRRFEVYPTELEGIQALLFDNEGQLYAGHPSGLYLLWPVQGVSPRCVLKDVNVLSLYQDVDRNLWVGTFGQGLYCLPAGASQWLHYLKDNGLTDESILSITGVSDMLWLATLGGVTRVQVEKPPHPYRLHTTNYNLADGLGTNFIYTAQADSKGRVWFGTDGKGLSVLENGQIRNYQYADTVPLHAVYSIAETVDGDICFVTDRDGVFRFDGVTFSAISLPLSLQDKEINNIVSDSLGNLLLAHRNGVDIITTDHNIVRYLESPTEPLSPNLNAHFRDSTGAVWIAGQQKIVRYNPLATATRNYPFTILNEVRVLQAPIDFRNRHALAAAENYLTFNFAGLWFSSPREVTFRYKVEGLDPDWKETREHSVTYQHMPPGEYRFVLESTTSGQYIASDQASYSFTISKPFYQRTGVLILSSLMTLLLFYVFFRWNQRRMEKAAMLQRRQIESQLQTLKAQINPHFLFNTFNTLVSVIEEDPKSAVEYVENLSDFYRSILKYRTKNLIPIAEEIEVLKSYAYILDKRYGSALQIEIAEQWKEALVVPLVLQILIENAVKHNVISERKPLFIRVRMKDSASIIVENTMQKKQVTEESTGFGLQSIISRYALICNSPVEVGQGSDTFFVIIPLLDKDEFPDT